MAADTMRRRAYKAGSNERSALGNYVYHSDANQGNGFFTLLDSVIDDTADEFKTMYSVHGDVDLFDLRDMIEQSLHDMFEADRIDASDAIKIAWYFGADLNEVDVANMSDDEDVFYEFADMAAFEMASHGSVHWPH